MDGKYIFHFRSTLIFLVLSAQSAEDLEMKIICEIPKKTVYLIKF